MRPHCEQSPRRNGRHGQLAVIVQAMPRHKDAARKQTRDESLMNKIAKLHIPDGGSCMGSQVVLEDGSKIGGIQKITLAGGIDQTVWGLHLEVSPRFINQPAIDAELLSVGMAKDIEQIHADTVLIVVRGECSRFESLVEAHLFRGHLAEFSKLAAKPVVLLGESVSLEQFDDEQLAALGLQRITN